MAVYVDFEEIKHERMKMCHMVADTPEELHVMADRIGVPREYAQRSRTGILHYDLCKSKRRLAVEHGAKEVDRRTFVGITRNLRQDHG